MDTRSERKPVCVFQEICARSTYVLNGWADNFRLSKLIRQRDSLLRPVSIEVRYYLSFIWNHSENNSKHSSKLATLVVMVLAGRGVIQIMLLSQGGDGMGKMEDWYSLGGTAASLQKGLEDGFYTFRNACAEA